MGDDVAVRLFDKMDDLKKDISNLRKDVEVLANEVKHSNTAQNRVEEQVKDLETRVKNTETSITQMQGAKEASSDITARLLSVFSIVVAVVGIAVGWMKR